jgi:hypothetical protein
MQINKTIAIIGVGLANLIHGGLHLVQFLQSLILLKESTETHGEDFPDNILHHPIFAFIWAIIGIFTLYIGIKDYIHHKKCKDETSHRH